MLNDTGTEIISDEKGGEDSNFRISVRITKPEPLPDAGIYYVAVSGFDSSSIGSYTLNVDQYPDDHGDTTDTATALMLGDNGKAAEAGRIGPEDDVDFFRLEITDPTRLIIYTTGGVDTYGRWYDETGTVIVFNSDGGEDSNFKISTPPLDAGIYYVEVSSQLGLSTGQYILHIVEDDHGDTADTATVLTLDGKSKAMVAGRIEPSDDLDFFRLMIAETITLTIYTTGEVDTFGRLYNEIEIITFDDDGGDGSNFRISRPLGVSPGTYYVEVSSRSESTGEYTLHVESGPVTLKNIIKEALGAMDGGILLLLLLVCLAGVARSLSLAPQSPRPRQRGD